MTQDRACLIVLYKRTRGPLIHSPGIQTSYLHSPPRLVLSLPIRTTPALRIRDVLSEDHNPAFRVTIPLAVAFSSLVLRHATSSTCLLHRARRRLRRQTGCNHLGARLVTRFATSRIMANQQLRSTSTRLVATVISSSQAILRWILSKAQSL
jgi:hypothetical protein